MIIMVGLACIVAFSIIISRVIKIQSDRDAEASAIRARAEALAANSNLVELTKAERWDGKLPSTVVPNGAMPFIDVKK